MSEKRRGSNSTVVRKRAQQAQAGTGGIPFTLPQGIEEWAPEEKGTVGLHILPYEVSRKGHPDGVKVGDMWYKRPFKVHAHVGPEDINIVCPTSIGMRCPICEEAKKLADADWKANEETIKKLRAKNFAAYNVVLDGEDKVRIFAVSTFKFSDNFEQELAEGREENACFDDPDEGKLVQVRFSEEDYQGHKFYKAVRFDFEERDPVPDEWLQPVVDLDAAIIVKDYDTIHDMLFGIEDPAKAAETAPEQTASDDGTGTGEEEAAPPPKKKPAAPPAAAPASIGGGKRKDEKKPAPPPPDPEPEEDPEPEPEPEPEEDDPNKCVACDGTGKTPKGNVCPICKGSKKRTSSAKPAETKKPEKKPKEETNESTGSGDEDWGDLDWPEGEGEKE